MDGSTVLKIRLPKKVKREFDKLVKMSNCTKSQLATKVIASYITREEKIIADLKQRMG